MPSETSFRARLDRLAAIRWGSAETWQPEARDLLFTYYERLLPFWPSDRVKVLPHSPAVLEAVRTRLSTDACARVEHETRRLITEAEARGPALTSTTKRLLFLILACSLLVDGGGIAPQDDPAEPLLQLFEAGYELGPHHGGVDVIHGKGMTTVPIPTRAALHSQRAAPQRASQAGAVAVTPSSRAGEHARESPTRNGAI